MQGCRSLARSLARPRLLRTFLLQARVCGRTQHVAVRPLLLASSVARDVWLRLHGLCVVLPRHTTLRGSWPCACLGGQLFSTVHRVSTGRVGHLGEHVRAGLCPTWRARTCAPVGPKDGEPFARPPLRTCCSMMSWWRHVVPQRFGACGGRRAAMRVGRRLTSARICRPTSASTGSSTGCRVARSRRRRSRTGRRSRLRHAGPSRSSRWPRWPEPLARLGDTRFLGPRPLTAGDIAIALR